MKPGPALVSRFILERTHLDASPVRDLDLIEQIILEQEWADTGSVARERAEAWHDQVITRIEHEINQLQEAGRPLRISLNSSSSDYIQGACFVEPGDSKDVVEQKKLRIHSDNFRDALMNLSAVQFELLCGRLLGLLGVEEPKVTKRTADDGIDFFGAWRLKNLLPEGLTPTIQQQLNVWIIGQAKRYQATQAGTPALRDLVGAIHLGRSGAFGGSSSPFHNFAIRISDPVFAFFVTTGSISANGWRLLNRSGVVGIDGEMLAAFLADHGIAIKEGKFSPSLFRAWVCS